MFKNAIVRKPCRNIVNGLSGADLGKPDYELAMGQHGEYVDALKECGLNVTVLEADENYPDSVFVEDTALLTSRCAVITNPGAPTRKGEINGIRDVIRNFFNAIEIITDPGTLEAGDVMMVGSHFYIGLSGRTNREGASQLIKILEKYDFTGSTVTLENILHLKSAVSYLENNNLLVAGNLINNPEFKKYNIIAVDENESYAANSLWVNGKIIIPQGFPETRLRIARAGYDTIEVDVTEYRKLDGGLSCLSLRF